MPRVLSCGCVVGCFEVRAGYSERWHGRMVSAACLGRDHADAGHPSNLPRFHVADAAINITQKKTKNARYQDFSIVTLRFDLHIASARVPTTPQMRPANRNAASRPLSSRFLRCLSVRILGGSGCGDGVTQTRSALATWSERPGGSRSPLDLATFREGLLGVGRPALAVE